MQAMRKLKEAKAAYDAGGNIDDKNSVEPDVVSSQIDNESGIVNPLVKS